MEIYGGIDDAYPVTGANAGYACAPLRRDKRFALEL